MLLLEAQSVTEVLLKMCYFPVFFYATVSPGKTIFLILTLVLKKSWMLTLTVSTKTL